MEGLNHIRGKKEVQRALKESMRKKQGVKVVYTTADKISIATHVLIHLYRELLNETPVHIEQIVEKPIVSLRVLENNWIKIKSKYLVDQKESGNVKDMLMKRILLMFKKYPQMIMVPLDTER